MGHIFQNIINEFHKAGIKSAIYLEREKWSSGQLMDASINMLFSRNYDPHFPTLLRLHNNSYTQFNLIGYSYGSLIAAQLAIRYATKGSKVDHLILPGSPISREFLTRPHNVANIQNIIVINLDRQGNPIYAGISRLELAANLLKLYDQMQNSTGHFYYAKEGNIGDKRRKLLADHLYDSWIKIMILNKKNISLALYIAAFSIILYVGIYVIRVGKTNITNSNGIGIYGAVAFYFYGLISAFIYLTSQLLKFNKELTAIYLMTSISLTGFIAWQPTWFQTP